MKYFILCLLGAIILTSCMGGSAQNNPEYEAEEYSFQQYKDKIVENIVYCDGCGSSGDLLIIHFKDGTSLRVYAYKYNMKIHE
jgi:hypothetical protein